MIERCREQGARARRVTDHRRNLGRGMRQISRRQLSERRGEKTWLTVVSETGGPEAIDSL